MPMMIEGSPFIRSITSWIGRAQASARRIRSRKTAMQTPIGSAITVAMPTRIAEPTIERGDATPCLTEDRQALREERPAEGARALLDHRVHTTSPRTRHGEQGGGCCDHLGKPVGEPPTAVRRLSPRSVGGLLERRHQRVPDRWTSKRRTMNWARGSSAARSRGGSRRGRRAPRSGCSRRRPGTAPRSGLRACRPARRARC